MLLSNLLLEGKKNQQKTLDVKGWKALGGMKQKPQSNVKVSLGLHVSMQTKHVSPQVQRLWGNCTVSKSVKLTTNLKGALNVLMFCNGADEMFADCEKGLCTKKPPIPVKCGVNESRLTISPSAFAQSSQAENFRSSLGGTG